MLQLEEDIVRLTESLAGLAALVVFGSRARGMPRADSDLDVAVLPATKVPEERRRLRASLAVALAELAPEGRVDIVFLDEAPELIRQRVLESGRLLICRDPATWNELRVRTMREHGDREWARDLMRDAQRLRLANGGTSGRSGRALDSLRRLGRLSR